MNILQSLTNYLKKKDTSEAMESPEGLCPNCWGREEYNGHFFDRVKQENLDINSTESNTGWILDYANKNLSGIALTRKGNGNTLVCEKCKTSYQYAEK